MAFKHCHSFCGSDRIFLNRKFWVRTRRLFTDCLRRRVSSSLSLRCVFCSYVLFLHLIIFFSLSLCCLPLVSPSFLSTSSLPSRFHNRCHLLRQIINSGKFQSLFPRPFNLPPPFLSIPSISLLFTLSLTPIFQPSSPPRSFSTKQQFASHLGKKKDTG